MSDPTWYKDAVIYELNVRGFCDGNNDGIGDFVGLTSKLDYLCDLGIDTLWLLPFYPSPGLDDGYDIADYRRIHESFGTMNDFEQFLSEAHARGLRVITELVLNHTSDQHEWFQRARNAPEGSPERDWYVWSDTTQRYEDTRIIFQDYEDSNWAFDPVAEKYYWHRFYSHQPDLNFDNPEVRQAVIDVLDFWMEKGVDGFRLDAVPYLYEREGTNCESLPETHSFLKELRRHVDDRFPGRMLLAEANQWPEEAADYFGDGDECHMNFHFPLMPRMYMALAREDRQPVVDILERTPEIPDTCQWATFLRNHDELTLEMVTDDERALVYSMFAPNQRDRINLGIRRRLSPLVQNDRRRLELMNGLLLSMPGTPVIYYGDEIGMGDNVWLEDRYGVRTPMQWSCDRNAGFSKASPQRLYLPVVTEPEYHYAAVNVEAQERNPTSLLSWFKKALSIRKQHRSFGRGNFNWVPTENRAIMAFVRGFYDNKVLVVANLAGSAQYCELDLSEWEGSTPVELFGQSVFPVVGEDPYPFTLAPYAMHWFAM